MYLALNRAAARLGAQLPLFETEGDYAVFERVLTLALEKHPIRELAYCLMPNHWHIVLWPRRVWISPIPCGRGADREARNNERRRLVYSRRALPRRRSPRARPAWPRRPASRSQGSTPSEGQLAHIWRSSRVSTIKQALRTVACVAMRDPFLSVVVFRLSPARRPASLA